MKENKEKSTKEKQDKAQADERKDHVLQTRVPKSMYEELARKAKRLRVPVSNLVRNIIEDSFRMVENIVDSSLDIAEALGNSATEEELRAVAGWQSLEANKDLHCARCGKSVPKGDEAFVSVGSPDGRTHLICGECKCDL